MSATSPAPSAPSAASPRASSTWIRAFHPSAPTGDPQGQRSAPRMICFPHAGGAATYYFPVSRALAGKIEVLAVQYPGRQDRHTEPAVNDVEALAARVFPELPLDDPGRTWFFGHSMGAAVAFEVARLVERELGRPLAGLIVSGRRAPSHFRGETVHQQGDDDFLASVQKLGGTDPAAFADPEVRRLFLPTLRADYQAIETYRPAGLPHVTCPVHAFVGDDDPLTTLDEADSWRDHTKGPFSLRVFPGNHFYLTSRADDVIGEISDLLLPGTPTAP
ncbi:thioesterase II family protein [Streptomyces sp. G45]|uniref:thioesterase II family protein n=1 Tax=Streptomyces sp. G45 TaxID=3406627 RepID=UPI003C19ABC9